MKRLSFRKRVLLGKDVKVYVKRMDGSIRAIYLQHVPFHYGLRKRGRV